MTKAEVIAWIRKSGLVPVVRAESVDQALHAIDALLEAGIDVLEVTMTVPNPLLVLETVVTRYSDSVLIGAGTVLNAETAMQCVQIGAQFIVSPALDVATVTTCKEMDVVVAPGALTPTEVLAAWNAGANVVKIFPCDAAGGATYIKSLKAPFPYIPLMPTGGVTLENIHTFLSAGAEAVGVGGSLVNLKLLASDRKAFITQARAFRQAAFRD